MPKWRPVFLARACYDDMNSDLGNASENLTVICFILTPLCHYPTVVPELYTVQFQANPQTSHRGGIRPHGVH